MSIKFLLTPLLIGYCFVPGLVAPQRAPVVIDPHRRAADMTNAVDAQVVTGLLDRRIDRLVLAS